jgi:hypothetical protein
LFDCFFYGIQALVHEVFDIVVDNDNT